MLGVEVQQHTYNRLALRKCLGNCLLPIALHRARSTHVSSQLSAQSKWIQRSPTLHGLFTPFSPKAQSNKHKLESRKLSINNALLTHFLSYLSHINPLSASDDNFANPAASNLRVFSRYLLFSPFFRLQITYNFSR